MAEALEQAAVLCDATLEVAIVERGYKGVALDGVKTITQVHGAVSHADYAR